MNPIAIAARTLEIQSWNLYEQLRRDSRLHAHSLRDAAYARYERRTRLTDQVRRLERMAA